MKLTLWFVVSMLFVIPAKASDLSVGWELWYPYQYHNKNLELVGLDIESFNAIMTEANLSYDMAEIPWKTHLHFIKTGKMDLAMGASWSKERETYAYFSSAYRKETVKLIVKKGNTKKVKLVTLADIAGSQFMIGVESGYYYGEEYEKLSKLAAFRANISEVVDLEENVSLLLKGHLDGFLVDPDTMQSFIQKYQMQGEFEEHSLEIYSADIFLMLSKKSIDVDVLQKINQAIKTLSDNGKLQNIHSRWHNSKLN